MYILKAVMLLIFSASCFTVTETVGRLLRSIFFWYDLHISFFANVIILAPAYIFALLIGSLLQVYKRRDHSERFLVATTAGMFFLSVILGYIDMSLENKLNMTDAILYFILIATPASILSHYLYSFFCQRIDKGNAWSLLLTINIFIVPLMFFALFSDIRTVPQKVVTANVSRSVQAPNVVLVTLDTFRFDLLFANENGHEIIPHINDLANNSVIFTQARSASSWTLPSHASIFTGLIAEEHGATKAHQNLDANFETIAERLSGRGYETVAYVGGPYSSQIYGLAQGFQSYSDRLDFFEWRHTPYLMNLRKVFQLLAPKFYYDIFKADGERVASEISSDVNSWLESRDDTRPFFLFLNFFDAHDPYNLGQDYRELFYQEKIDVKTILQKLDTIGYHPKKRYFWTDVSKEFLQQIKALYYAEAHYLDKIFTKLMKEIQQQYPDTYFVITSDHGEEFFEHGGAFHDQTLYEEVIRVPLFIYGPNLNVASYSDLVETRKLFHVIDLFSQYQLSNEELLAVLASSDSSSSYLSAREGYWEREIRAVSTAKSKKITMTDPVGRLREGDFVLDNSGLEILNSEDGK